MARLPSVCLRCAERRRPRGLAQLRRMPRPPPAQNVRHDEVTICAADRSGGPCCVLGIRVATRGASPRLGHSTHGSHPARFVVNPSSWSLQGADASRACLTAGSRSPNRPESAAPSVQTYCSSHDRRAQKAWWFRRSAAVVGPRCLTCCTSSSLRLRDADWPTARTVSMIARLSATGNRSPRSFDRRSLGSPLRADRRLIC